MNFRNVSLSDLRAMVRMASPRFSAAARLEIQRRAGEAAAANIKPTSATAGNVKGLCC